MKQIHAQEISPDIPLIIEDLKSFTIKVFKPLDFYLDISNLDGSEFTELQLWHVTLHMLASLSNLHTLTCEDYNSIILNASILAPLNSLNLCFKVLEGYIKLDDHSAVSYTHLDVYKRQLIYLVTRRFISFSSWKQRQHRPQSIS